MSVENTAVEEHDRETALALSVAVAIGFIALAAIAVFGAAWAAVGVDLASSALTFGTWALARGRRLAIERLIHAVCAIAAMRFFTIAMISGQADSLASWQILLVPVIAATMLGVRGAITWLIPSAALLALVHLLEHVVPITPLFEPSPLMHTIGGVVQTGFALAYMAYTHGAAQRHLRTAGEREHTIAAQTELLYRAHGEIVRARDEAVQALQGKTEFLATVSHELRAPLNGLIGLSSVLLESKMTPQQTELVRTLHQSAGSMRKILNDVLDLTRIESGKLELREESADIREIIGEVLDVFAPGAADKGIELAAIVEPDVPSFLRIDPVRFGQVLTNLVSNALKFTATGEIVVELRRKSTKLLLSVRDTGHGIAPGDQERLFRPFEQTASAEASREIGSGLGLWITQRIVEAMGGTIGVESELRKGSCFFVEWEAKPGDAVGRESMEFRRGVRIIAVEDNEASARALECMAPALDIEVTVARSLNDVTRIVKEIEDPLLVLVDATLPGVTTTAAAEALRALPELRRLPLVSAVAPSAERVRVGIQPPFVATTLKPYRTSRMRALLSDVLSPRPAMPTPVMLSPWRPLDVLVVDDDSTNRLVAMLLLERAGLRPHAAAGGEDALALLSARRYDLVLLDLHMGGIDGLETARRIRAELDPQHRLWIVALTASVYDEDRQRCLDAGMDDFIPKPIEIGLFRAALERAQRAVRRRTTPSSTNRTIALDGGIQAKVLEKLYDALDRDAGELSLLVDDYVRSSAELCVSLRHAITGKNVKEAQRAAHTLASSSGQLGAYRLEKLARTLEHEAASGALPDEKQVDLLHEEREMVVVRMHEWIGERLQ